MRKFLLALAGLLIAVPAWADSAGSATGGTAGTQSDLAGCIYQSSPPTLSSGQQSGLACTSDHTLIVSGTVTPTGTGDVNLKQVNGTTVTVGAGTGAAGTQRVTTSTDSTIGTLTAGNVGGFTFQSAATVTTTATTYTAGQCIGAPKAFTVGRTASGTITLANLSVRSLTGLTPTIQVYITNAAWASPCTDAGSFSSFASFSESAKVPPGGTFQVTLAVPTGGTVSTGAATGINLNMSTDASSQIYVTLVATANTVVAATADIQEAVSGFKD